MITPINTYYNYHQPYNYSKKSPNFKGHPEFHALEEYFNITASNFFRRGCEYGKPSSDFANVEEVLKNVFAENSPKPKKMLVAGIGKSQEPLSYLASIKEIIGDTPLAQKVELYTVDMQSQPQGTNLFFNSFYDADFFQPPVFARSSFIKDCNPHAISRYRVKDEILEFLKETYKNPARSKWDTRIQDVIEDYPTGFFDIVSVNNTMGYITNRKELDKTFKNIYRIFNRDGYFITDIYKFKTDTAPHNNKDLKEVYKGIYKYKNKN